MAQTTNKFTVYVTYFLENNTGSGYTNAVHCNYIQKFGFETTVNQEVNIYFQDESDFKFLSPTGSAGTGFVANEICMLVQIVSNTLIETNPDIYEENRPQSHLWKCFDVTDQIVGHTSGDTLTASGLTSGVFKVALNDFNATGTTLYNLEYLNYPQNSEPNALGFGDEEIFLGNVDTDIEATVYTTDLSITLPLNEYNSTTNPTWDSEAQDNSVYITEVGLFNEDRELIAIGKLNNPLKKNNQISRTIVFGMDF